MSLKTWVRMALQTPRTLMRVASVCLILNFLIAAVSRHADPRWSDLLDAGRGVVLGVSIPLMLMAVRRRSRQGRCASH